MQYDTGRGIFMPSGHGGGIFDGDLSGLGGDAERFPWLGVSDDTKALQKSTNVALSELGYCTLSTDGKLGPVTCGGRQLAHDLYSSQMLVPSTCQSFTKPRHTSQGCVSSQPRPSYVSPVLTQESAALPSPGMSPGTRRVLAFAVGAGAVGLGFYFWSKRKGGARAPI